MFLVLFLDGFGNHLDYLVGSCLGRQGTPPVLFSCPPAIAKSLPRIDVKEDGFVSSSTLVKGFQAIMAKGSGQQEFKAAGPWSGCKDQ